MSTRLIPVSTHHELCRGDLVEAEGCRFLRPLRRGRFRFRCGPVPGLGRRGSYGRSLRHPRTTAARRAAAGFHLDDPEAGLAQDGGVIRLRRLPHAYDDLMRADINVRSWKRHRAKQHRTT